MAEWGAAPAGPVYATGSPGVSGDTARPNYVGPSGNGLVEADERRAKNLRDQGRSVWPPLSVSRRRSRDLRKTPRWSAERRAGPRYGPAIPSADGRGLVARQANGCGDPRPRISALRFPHLGLRRVRNRQFGTTARRDAPRGNAPARFNKCTEKGAERRNDDVEVCAPHSPPSFRGAPKARARNPGHRDFLRLWIPGSPP